MPTSPERAEPPDRRRSDPPDDRDRRPAHGGEEARPPAHWTTCTGHGTGHGAMPERHRVLDEHLDAEQVGQALSTINVQLPPIRSSVSPAFAPSATGCARDQAITATPAAAPNSSAPTARPRRGTPTARQQGDHPDRGHHLQREQVEVDREAGDEPLPVSQNGRPAPPARAASQTASTTAVMLHCRGA